MLTKIRATSRETVLHLTAVLSMQRARLATSADNPGISARTARLPMLAVSGQCEYGCQRLTKAAAPAEGIDVAAVPTATVA
jgi:hypothetical protein